MKNGILFFAFVLLSFVSKAQWNGVCDGNTLYPYNIDSTDFSGAVSNHFFFEIDTSLSNNLWQVGAIQKASVPNSVFGGAGIQTDTINSYDSNNTSAFIVWTDSTYQAFPWSQDSMYTLSFWHYYNVDSLSDSCMVQLSVDSGKNWLNAADYTQSPFLWWHYQIDNALDPNSSGKFLWTGRSDGWQKVTICAHYGFPIKPSRHVPYPIAWRFLFKSDSTQTNKPGWIIDKIGLKNPVLAAGVNNLRYNSLSIYPNPSNDGQFHIDFPSSYVYGKFYVYNLLGDNVKTTPLKESIDLSDLPSGLYSYKALFEKTNQWFSGKIEIR